MGDDHRRAPTPTAGIHPDDIDTGAVILTGEALRRENAKAIAEVFAEMGGEFVCATAGHHMEALLAAYGSGAARASHDLRRPVLNVDIGGGTTKLALVENGERGAHRRDPHRRPAAGGRCGRPHHAARPGRRAARAERAGFDWQLGGVGAPRPTSTASPSRWPTRSSRALTQSPPPPTVEALWLTDPLEPVEGIAGVMFSGGVGRIRLRPRDARLRRPRPAPRARAARGSTRARCPSRCCPPASASARPRSAPPNTACSSRGNTVYISNPGELLPRKNLQVLQPDLALDDAIDPARVTQAIRAPLRGLRPREGEAEVALASAGSGRRPTTASPRSPTASWRRCR